MGGREPLCRNEQRKDAKAPGQLRPNSTTKDTKLTKRQMVG